MQTISPDLVAVKDEKKKYGRCLCPSTLQRNLEGKGKNTRGKENK